MVVQKRFSNAASKKPNDYIPDEMKHDFLLLSPCDSKMNYPEISSRTGKSYAKILLSVQHKWRFSAAVISATFGAWLCASLISCTLPFALLCDPFFSDDR